MHIAARKGNIEAAEILMKVNSQLALSQNFAGETPFHIAISTINMQFLQTLSPMKIEALYVKNADGENPLFFAARLGNLDIFNWFAGKIDFFKARGE